ncbi:PQQ-binding-like beta-propeller repeat protein [Nonomuraea wenchangensis]
MTISSGTPNQQGCNVPVVAATAGADPVECDGSSAVKSTRSLPSCLAKPAAAFALVLASLAAPAWQGVAQAAADKTQPGAGSVYAPGWSSAHADAANTDYSPVKGARELAPAWRRSFEGAIYLGATSDDSGHVYVTTNGRGCHLHALDRRTGKTVWCSREINRDAVASSALLDRDGHVYLADSEAMHAFDAKGRLLWATEIVGTPLSAQFTPAGNVIFITHLGRIYVLNRATGKPILDPVELIPNATPHDDQQACMRGTEDCPSANTLAVDLKRSRIYFTFWDKGAPRADIRAMKLVEGSRPSIRPLWRNPALPGGSATSPDLSQDGTRVYVGDNEGGLHALNAATGKKIWSFATGNAAGGSPSLSPTGLLMPAGGDLMAVQDLGDRPRLLWKKEGVKSRGIPTQAAGGVAYATVGKRRSNELVVIDTATGAELDREAMPGLTAFSVGTTVGVDGMVFVSGITGELFAFRPAR